MQIFKEPETALLLLRRSPKFNIYTYYSRCDHFKVDLQSFCRNYRVSQNKNTVSYIDAHCHGHCRRDPRITKDCIGARTQRRTFMSLPMNPYSLEITSRFRDEIEILFPLVSCLETRTRFCSLNLRVRDEIENFFHSFFSRNRSEKYKAFTFKEK